MLSFKTVQTVPRVFLNTAQKLRELKKIHSFAARSSDTEANREEVKKRFMDVRKRWSVELLEMAHLKVRVAGTPTTEPCLFVSNHTGYLDIPVLLSLLPQGCFLSKKELLNWPIVGSAATAGGTLFVDRKSAKSRQEISIEIGKHIGEKKLSMMLFPEGTSSALGKPWKKGAFHIAESLGLQVQPVSLCYYPHRLAVYDGDPFFPHLAKVLESKQLSVVATFGEVFRVENSKEAVVETEKWVSDQLRQSLKINGELQEIEMLHQQKLAKRGRAKDVVTA